MTVKGSTDSAGQKQVREDKERGWGWGGGGCNVR